MADQIMKRTRAKTPVFSVGQLEASPHHDALSLAEHYRSLLPPRLETPFSYVEDEEHQVIPRRSLRKIKRQHSLRSLMKLHSRAVSISDSETLIGSPTPTSPTNLYFDFKKSPESEELELELDEQPISLKQDRLAAGFDNDMALKICVDLLTRELSTAFDMQNGQPPLNNERGSGLQVLLMIEVYESVQQNLRRKRYSSIEIGEKAAERVHDVERILEYWLHVLYSVYDRSHELSSKGNEEYFPLPLSVKSRDHEIVKKQNLACTRIGWNEGRHDENFF